MKLYSLIYITTNNNLLPRGISILTLIYLLSVKECTKRIFVCVIKCCTFDDNLYFLILSAPFVCKLQNVKKKKPLTANVFTIVWPAQWEQGLIGCFLCITAIGSLLFQSEQ